VEQIIFALLGFGGAGLVFLGGSSLRSQTKPEQRLSQPALVQPNIPQPYASIYDFSCRRGEMTVRDLMRSNLPALTNANMNRAAEVYHMLEKMNRCQWVKLSPAKSFSASRFIAIPNARGLPIRDRPVGF
jgi:hypothetical protein